MRRTTSIVLLGVAFSMMLVADALGSAAAPNATAPSRVDRGLVFVVHVQNCVAPAVPQDAEAWIVLESPDALPAERVADADGTSDVKHTLFKGGATNLVVRCEHDTGAATDVVWEETLPIEVVEPAPSDGSNVTTPTLTAEERAKCKKIKNRAKRKRCMKRESAD